MLWNCNRKYRRSTPSFRSIVRFLFDTCIIVRPEISCLWLTEVSGQGKLDSIYPPPGGLCHSIYRIGLIFMLYSPMSDVVDVLLVPDLDWSNVWTLWVLSLCLPVRPKIVFLSCMGMGGMHRARGSSPFDCPYPRRNAWYGPRSPSIRSIVSPMVDIAYTWYR